MANKNLDEKIKNLDEKINQLEAQKKALAAKAKEQERKDRTRRLIQIGAIVESIGINTILKAELFKKGVLESENIKNWLYKTIKTENNDNIKEENTEDTK